MLGESKYNKKSLPIYLNKRNLKKTCFKPIGYPETPFSKTWYQIETNHLICSPYQVTGFCMVQAFMDRNFWIDYSNSSE